MAADPADIIDGTSAGGAGGSSEASGAGHGAADAGVVQLAFVDAPQDDDFVDAAVSGASAAPAQRVLARAHQNPDWSAWDGGKVGGVPVWLDPRPGAVPGADKLACPVAGCGKPMLFLVQMYAPLDEVEAAFHRTLYVFACGRAGHVGKGGVKVLRCQLPQNNGVYASSVEEVGTGLPTAHAASSLCAVCGAAGALVCGRCRGVRYCGKQHQALHWKRGGHKTTCAPAAPTPGTADAKSAVQYGGPLSGEWTSAARAPELVLEIDDEPPRDERVRAANAADGIHADVVAAATSGEAVEAKGDDDLDMTDLTQQSLAESSGAAVAADPVMRRFLRRVAVSPGQVLRYARWQERAPLWVSRKHQPAGYERPHGGAAGDTDSESDSDEDEPGSAAAGGESVEEEDRSRVPPCEHCGGPRGFEFQITPQLLHYMKTGGPTTSAGAAVGDIDFGTLAVFTCRSSCSSGDAYVEEAAWVQVIED